MAEHSRMTDFTNGFGAKMYILKLVVMEEGCAMGRRRGIMSEQFKLELAKELGFYDTVEREGWGGITTRDAGNMVKRAIEIAERSLGQQGGQR
jgi:small acid-soluble spore protein F (minor alpha/beta-type SASP)